MKLKQKYNIGKALSLAGLMMLANACQKEHDVVIDWRTGPISNATSKKESLLKEINKKNVNMIFLDFGERNMTNWYPALFNRAHDTLQTYMDMAPGHIRFMGTFYVSSRYGAHLPDVNIDTIAGMGLLDSIWWTANGVKVMRLPLIKEK